MNRRLAAADACLLAVLVASPLAAGTTHFAAWAIVWLLSMAALGLALGAKATRPEPPRLLIALGVVWGVAVLLPLVPLPAGLASLLSPTAARTWALGPPGAEGAAPAWSIAHMAPGEGWFEVLRWATTVAFGAACVLRAGDPRWRTRALGAVAVAGGVAAVVCLVQTQLDVRPVLGIYEPRWDNRSFWLAPILNENHWSAWLSLVSVVSAGLALRPGSGSRRAALAGVTVLTGGLVLFAPSRIGLVGLGASFAALLVLSASRSRRPSLRRLVVVLVVVGLIGLAGVARTWGGWGTAGVDPQTGETMDALASNDRLGLLPDAVAVVRAAPLVGVGRGAVVDVLPRYQTVPGTPLYRWFEVLPADLLASHGLPLGGLLFGLLVAVVVIGLGAARRDRRRVGAAAALAGLLVHEMGDFATQGGAVLLTATLLAVLALRGRHPSTCRSPRRFRYGVLIAIELAVIPFVTVAADHWDAVRCMDREAAALRATEADPAEGGEREWRWHPSSFPIAQQVAVEYARRGDFEAALPWLNRAQLLAPRHPDPHLYTARVLWRLGYEAQALVEYRLAIEGDPRNRALPVLGEVAARYPEAWQLERILPADRADGPAMFAQWLSALGDDRAAHFAELARERDPDAATTAVALAVALVDAGRSDEAITWIESAWSRGGLTPWVERKLAVAMAAAGRPDRALARLRKVPVGALDPGPEFWLVLGELELLAGEPVGVRVASRRVRAAHSPEHTARSLCLEARLSHREGQTEEALQLVGRAIDAGSPEASWLALEASLLLEVGRAEDSLAAARAALHIDPDSVEAAAAASAAAEALTSEQPR